MNGLLYGKALFLSGFLEQYYTRPMAKDWFKNLSLGIVISIFRRHWMVQQVASDCWSRTILVNPIAQKVICSPPSWSEVHRVFRGLYLFALHSLLHASDYLPSENTEYGEIRVYSSAETLNGGFLPALQVWEAEEVLCIYEYLVNSYYRIVRGCSHVLTQLENDVTYCGSNKP